MTAKKKIVVIGGGFAGLQLIRNLDQRLFDVLLIDRQNHHQFQPLFYQVATSQLEPSSISFPFRKIFQHHPNVQVRLAEVSSVNPAGSEVITSMGSFRYDILVIATGCRTNFFGNGELMKHALTLKSTYESISLRNHILENLEQLYSASEAERPALQNIIIAGAGPTGVELAGAFAEIRQKILPKDYPGLDFSGLHIYLVEGSPHTLNSMSSTARESSRRYLERLGVEVTTGVLLLKYNGLEATLSDGRVLPSKNLIWAAGVTGNAVEGLPPETAAPGNRIRAGRYNNVTPYTNFYVLGDLAYMETPRFPKGHPQLANVAINQAKNLAANLKRKELGKPLLEFEYRDLGSMATIGRHKAVVDLPFIRFKGYLAWLTWMFLHLMLILSVRNKLIIFINWAWTYVTSDTSLRLILRPGVKNNTGAD